MPGTRKYGSVDETTAKLSVVVPLDIDRELRALAGAPGNSGRSDDPRMVDREAERRA
jgi:hypothetical protein